MFFVNQYIMSKQDDGTQKLTKAAYDRDNLYKAQAEFHRRQGDAMNAKDTIWTLCMIVGEDGAVYASEKAVKPAEPETTTEA